MATNPDAFGLDTVPPVTPVDPAAPPVGEASPVAGEPAPDPNVLVFTIPNTETKISVNLGEIPPAIRMDFFKTKVRDYIVNSVNQVNVRHTKAMEPFNAYIEAMKVDPLQTAVPAPAGEAPVVDLITPAAEARKRLYEGNVRKQSEGGKPRETKDPFIKLVTDAVVRELFDKNKGVTSGYKWTDAVKAVGGDGIKYLDGKIAEKVAAGADAAALAKFKDERYVKPARMMLGMSDNKATKDVSLL